MTKVTKKLILYFFLSRPFLQRIENLRVATRISSAKNCFFFFILSDAFGARINYIGQQQEPCSFLFSIHTSLVCSVFHNRLIEQRTHLRFYACWLRIYESPIDLFLMIKSIRCPLGICYDLMPLRWSVWRLSNLCSDLNLKWIKLKTDS